MAAAADLDLQDIHDTLVLIAFDAGRMILTANPSDIDQGTKLNSADIVTECDKAVEAHVSSVLRQKYPSYAFMGEETYQPGQTLGPEPTFVVDPIDGTTNFVHGFPHACISLGFAADRVPTVGVVYNPYLDTLYTAIRGKGAYMTVGRSWGLGEGGRGSISKLPLAKTPQPLGGLDSALLAVEWGSSRDDANYELKADVFRRLCLSKTQGGAMVHSLRSLGSAALNLCAVAAGQLDLYWEGGCWAWDVCAAWTILAEAGGIMAGGNPGVWDPQIDGRKYLAVRGAPAGQREIVEEMWAVIGDRKMDYTSTKKKYHLHLQGEIHPVFANWADADPDLLAELRQPLLLASRLVERAGLAWISDFLIDDIFDEHYPGHETQTQTQTIVRHHDADWATAELKRSWIVEASEELKRGLPMSIEWHMDPDMFREKGWVGYTCRHPRGDMPVNELDARGTIEDWDHRARRSQRKQRRLSLLVMAEFPQRMKELARDSEEYLLTAFMAAVTLIHELGHAIFWKDFRSLTREMTEPFYGTDLEMELGSSLVANIFGGWVPVPIKDPVKFREKPTLESGLAWRQHLDWKYHRMRPKYRAHYSIPVEYVARLFKEQTWEDNDNLRLKIQPRTLNKSRNELGLNHNVEMKGMHAAAALADFHIDGDGWRWNGRAGAPFRIPQYDGSLWPDLDMPVAIDGVIRETAALDPISQLARETKSSSSSSPAKKAPGWRHHSRIDSILSVSSADSSPSLSPVRGLPFSQQRLPASRLSQAHYPVQRPSSSISIIVSSSDSPLQQGKPKEITVDELKKRLSRFIGVSMEEIDDFFTGS